MSDDDSVVAVQWGSAVRAGTGGLVRGIRAAAIVAVAALALMVTTFAPVRPALADPVAPESAGLPSVLDGSTLRELVAGRPEPATESDRYIIELRDPTIVEHALSLLRTGSTLTPDHWAARILQAYEFDVRYVFQDAGRGFVAGRATAAALREILDDPRVVGHSRDEILRPAVSVREDAAWGLDRIDQVTNALDGRYHHSTDGSGALVYVIDTGLDWLNPSEFGSIAPCLIRTNFFLTTAFPEGFMFAYRDHICFGAGGLGGSIAGTTSEAYGFDWDVICDDAGDCYWLGGLDYNGHGTHVAGSVSGQTYGVAPGARLISVKANEFGDGSYLTSDIVAALDFVVANRRDTSLPGRGARVPAVVNMSLGGTGYVPAFDAAVQRLIRDGIVVVAAAGNSDSNACGFYPAGFPNVITVAATDTDDRRWQDPDPRYGSNFGSCVDIFAPGVDIPSAGWDMSGPTEEILTGTSMAAPHVAGVAARYLGRSPTATPSRVRQDLIRGSLAAVQQAGAGSPNRLLNTHFLEGRAPSALRTPRLTGLRIGQSVNLASSMQATGPVTFELADGSSLPAGLTLQQDGRITGTVTGFGSGTAVIVGRDAIGCSLQAAAPWSSSGTPDVGQVDITLEEQNGALLARWETDAFEAAGVALGEPVSRVEVRATPPGARSPGRACAVQRNTRTGQFPLAECRMAGLLNGQVHVVQVRAQNRTGWSPWVTVAADPERLTPVPVAPSVVQSLRVTAATGRLTVSWTAPRDAGGEPPRYDVQVRAIGGGDWIGGDSPSASDLACSGLTSLQRSCAITGEQLGDGWGEVHEVRVRAWNSRGSSDWVVVGPVTPFTIPDVGALQPAPAGDVDWLLPGERSLAVGWGAAFGDVAVSRGAPIDRVEVRAVPGSGSVRTCTASVSRGILPAGCTVTGMVTGVEYEVSIRARSRAGWSTWTLASDLDGPFAREGVIPLAVLPSSAPAAAGGLQVTGELRPGVPVTLTGSGFLPSSRVRLVLYPERDILIATDADVTGRIAVTVEMPQDLADGERTLVAFGTAPSGARRILGVEFVVDRTGPEIVSVSPSGITLRPGESFTVSVTVRDPSGIASVGFSFIDGQGDPLESCAEGPSFVSADVSTRTETWEASCVVPESVVSGGFRIEAFAQDRLGNVTDEGDGTLALVVGSFTVE